MVVSGMDIKTANTLLFPKQEPDWWLNKINGNIANSAAMN